MKIGIIQEFTNEASFCWFPGLFSLRHDTSEQTVYFDSLSQGLGMLRAELGMTKFQFVVMLWYAIVKKRSHCPEYVQAVKNIVHKQLRAA